MLNQKNTHLKESNLHLLGWVILCIRFVQGWVFWGGGSRRFIYDPQKLDPYAPQWMANKLQSTLSGVLFDIGYLVSYLLHHFILLYVAIIIFSLLELISGLGLIFGFFTRAAAMITLLVSVMMMILFGWQGSTCMDEWTMAVCNVSMALTLILSGGPVFSVDAWLMKKYPGAQQSRWFMMFGSVPWSYESIRRVAGWFFMFTLIFTLGTYNYYRGAIFSFYHAGPVSADVFHLALSEGKLNSNGSLSFKLNVNAGPVSVPVYIVRMELQDSTQRVIESWDASNLRALPKSAIHNSYAYNQIEPGVYGLIAPESAEAKIVLPSSDSHENKLTQGRYMLKIYTVDGKRWDLPLSLL